MKVVLDTNIYIAAFAARGLCASILEWCLEESELLASEALFDEIRKNLAKKCKLPEPILIETMQFLRDGVKTISLDESLIEQFNVCRDLTDRHVLALAVSENADALVSGDQDLLVLKRIQSIPIFSPRAFYERICRGVA